MITKLYDTPPIGHSFGWFNWRVSPELRHVAAVINGVKADAAELTCTEPERELALVRGALAVEEPLTALSMHLGSYVNFELLSDIEKTAEVEKVANAIERHAIGHTALHPDIAPGSAIQRLCELKVPVAIENMDRRKAIGRTVQDVIEICERHQIPLLIDLQHTYENAVDSGLAPHELAVQFAQAALQNSSIGISHLHVSGEISHAGTQSRDHASLLDATNLPEILAAIKAVRDQCEKRLPLIILEGDYTPNMGERQGVLTDEQISDRSALTIERMRKERELLMDELGYS